MSQKAITTTTTKLKLVEEQPLELGPLSKSYETLGRQEVIDFALTFASAITPEWAAEETVLALPALKGRAKVLTTLEATDPQIAPETVILRSGTSKTAEGISTVILVEGAFNALLVATFATGSTVCCTLGSEPLTVDSVTDVLPRVKGARVVLLLKQNPALDIDTYTRASEVTGALKRQGATTVGVLLPPLGSLSEFLKPLPDPSQALSNLLQAAKAIKAIHCIARPTTGVMPTWKDGHLILPPYVSAELGQIVSISPEQLDENGKPANPRWWRFAGFLEGQRVYATNTLMTAAPRVVRIISEIDDLDPNATPKLSYELEVQLGPANNCRVRHITVTAAMLDKPAEWRQYLGSDGAAIQLGELGQGPAGGRRIAEVIGGTVTVDTPKLSTIHRTGWCVDAEGVPCWVDSTGAHGPDGKTTRVVSGVLPKVQIPSATDYSPEEIHGAVHSLLDVAEWVNPTAWAAGVAATFLALAGSYPEAVLWLVGRGGSGKSLLIGLLAGMIGNYGPKESMIKPETSVPAFRGVLEAAHNLPLWIDDYRPRSTMKTQDLQDASIEMAIRCGPEGTTAIAQKQEQVSGRAGEWQTRTQRDAHPVICVAGESLPNEHNASSIERLLAIELNREGRRPGGKEYLEGLHERKTLKPAAAAFLRWRAAVIANEHGSDIEAARSSLRTKIRQVARQHLDLLDSESWRIEEVTETFLGGLYVFFEFCAEIGALTRQEADERHEQWARLIVAAAQRHANARLSQGSRAEQIIQVVQAALASREYVLGPSDGHPQSIGTVTRLDGVQCVALITTHVDELVRRKLNTYGNSVVEDLRPVLIEGKERPQRKVRVNGPPVWTYAIQPDKMDPSYRYTGDGEVEEEENESAPPKRKAPKWFDPRDGKYHPYE